MKPFSFSRVENGGGARKSDFVFTPEWAERKRQAMVDEQLRQRGIRDLRVLQAMNEIPRHEYVPAEFAAKAYEDHPVAIGHGQSISQPYMVGTMTEALELQGWERVLDVGTGSGYQAAVLSRLSGCVYSIERDPDLFEKARERLTRLGLANSITLVLGDGSQGYPPGAPYDAILVAAAAPEVPECYLEQLNEGGRLVIPVGPRESQELLKVRKLEGKGKGQSICKCIFVPLTGRRGWNPD